MKGTIRANLGASRYTVGIPYAEEPLASLKEEAQKAYEGAIQQRLEALKALAAAEEPYNAILAEIEWATASYDACRIEFDYSSQLAAAIAICDADYSACYNACNPIEGESKPAEEIFACQKQCAAARDTCHEPATIDTKNQEIAHLTECQETWSPLIADLQTQALELMAPVQEAMYQLKTAEALELSTARRINELDQVAAVEQQITCWRAQYDDGLTAGTEVEVARTPSGRHVITEIYPEAEERCLQEARALPPKHLFVNAAVAPGFETWLPTWRVGVVKAIVGDKLQVEVQGGAMSGSLGTIYSRNPINCTPPQAYFDGNWQESEARIKAAREALAEAQEDKTAAVKDRDDCISQYDQTWFNACYTDKTALCDSTWATWLAECEALEGIDPQECLAQYQASLAACYAQALADCDEQRDTLIAACREEWQPAVDAAAAVVAQATDDLQNQLSGIYQPADPLVLTLPVEHCAAGRYQVGDEVTVDFPVRSGQGPMVVWDSARIVGWASNTRECLFDILMTSTDGNRLLGCDGELLSTDVAVPDQYWAGSVNGRDAMLYWSGSSIFQAEGELATVSHTVEAATIRAQDDGTGKTKQVLVYAAKTGAGVDIYARDLSLPSGEQTDSKVAAVSYPAGYNDDLFSVSFFAFSASGAQIALLNRAYNNTYIGPYDGFRGRLYTASIPTFTLPNPTPQNISFTLFAQGDEIIEPESGNYNISREVLIGAQWNGEVLEPFTALFELDGQRVENYDNKELTNEELEPFTGPVEGHRNSEIIGLENSYVTFTGHDRAALRSSEYQSSYSLSVEITSVDFFNDTGEYWYDSNDALTSDQAGTLSMSIIGIQLKNAFCFPFIYRETSPHVYSSSINVKSIIKENLTVLVPEDFPGGVLGKAEEYLYWLASTCKKNNDCDENRYWITSYELVQADDTMEFYCGKTKTGKANIDKNMSDLELFNWYSNINSIKIYNPLNISAKYTTIPCPAAQVTTPIAIGTPSATDTLLFVSGSEVSAAPAAQALTPLRPADG